MLTPLRKFCASPVLPRVRAILSWEHEPTAGDPGYVPVWGEVQEDHIQIRPRRRFFPVDILDVIGPLVQLDPATIGDLIDIDLLPTPIPEPDPIGPVALNPQPLPPGPDPDPVPFSVERLSRIYSPDKLKVLAGRALDQRIARLALEEPPPHRLAATEVSQACPGCSHRAWSPRRSRSRSASSASTGPHWWACSARARATPRTRSWSASGSTTTPASSSPPIASSGRPVLRAAVQRRLEGVRRLLGRLRRRLHVDLSRHRRRVGSRLHHDAGRRPVVCGDPAARRQRLPAPVHRAGTAPGAGRAVVEHAAVHHRPRSPVALGQPHRHPRARAAGSALRRNGAAEHRRWRRYRRDRPGPPA